MTIVAFLQNQWFDRPEVVRKVYDEHPERRERLNSAYLFMGCKTGRMLKSAFGKDLCDQIVWENVSPEIGGEASSKFPPDPEHVARVLEKHQPGIVLLFGKVAESASHMIPAGKILLIGPHPAARSPATLANLRVMRMELEKVMAYAEPTP